LNVGKVLLLAKQTQLHAEKTSVAGIEVTRGATRLDGVRGKKQVWRLHARTWGLSEVNLLLKKVLVTLLVVFGAPIMIRRQVHNQGCIWGICPPKIFKTLH